VAWGYGDGATCDQITGNCCPGPDEEDPILIDLDGSGFDMTPASDGVLFDFFGNGKPLKLSWTAAGAPNAWLALDLNGNGTIDNGTELLGNAMPLPSGGLAANGWRALAIYDQPKYGGNGDGVIDTKDAIYPKLLLWVDKNHDGISQPDELLTLPQAGIASIDLKYHKASFKDSYGNYFRYRAKVTDAKGDNVGRWAYDVFLVRDRSLTASNPGAARVAKTAPSPHARHGVGGRGGAPEPQQRRENASEMSPLLLTCGRCCFGLDSEASAPWGGARNENGLLVYFGAREQIDGSHPQDRNRRKHRNHHRRGPAIGRLD
jgi:hypothetical protein